MEELAIDRSSIVRSSIDHCVVRSLHRSFVHCIVRSFLHRSFLHRLLHRSFIESFVRPIVRSFVPSFVPFLVPSSVCPSLHHTFVRSFIHSIFSFGSSSLPASPCVSSVFFSSIASSIVACKSSPAIFDVVPRLCRSTIRHWNLDIGGHLTMVDMLRAEGPSCSVWGDRHIFWRPCSGGVAARKPTVKQPATRASILSRARKVRCI